MSQCYNVAHLKYWSITCNYSLKTCHLIWLKGQMTSYLCDYDLSFLFSELFSVFLESTLNISGYVPLNCASCTSSHCVSEKGNYAALIVEWNYSRVFAMMMMMMMMKRLSHSNFACLWFYVYKWISYINELCINACLYVYYLFNFIYLLYDILCENNASVAD